jgi:hypothetical protein
MRQRIESYKIIRPSEKEAAFMNVWEHQRESPKWRFILLHGILKEGLLLFTLIKLIQFIIEKDAFFLFYSSLQGVVFLLFEIVFWSFGGFVIGWFKHNTREIEYELLKGLSD